MGTLENLKELEEELKKAREEVSRIELELELKLAWPQEGDACYKVDPTGTIEEAKFSLKDASENPLIIPYQTYEAAASEVARRQATIRVIRRVAELNKGWSPNWNSRVEEKWYIGISKPDGVLFTYTRRDDSYIPDVYAIASGKDALLLIREMEVELQAILG